MDVGEIGFEGVETGYIWLRIRTRGGLLCPL